MIDLGEDVPPDRAQAAQDGAGGVFAPIWSRSETPSIGA